MHTFDRVKQDLLGRDNKKILLLKKIYFIFHFYLPNTNL